VDSVSPHPEKLKKKINTHFACLRSAGNSTHQKTKHTDAQN
jgi:hypothetical protein